MASAFNKKAALWIKGRQAQVLKPAKGCIWFHFASLGEFEQGRPVLEAMKERFPYKSIVITFFSPSGYQVRKNTPLADAVYYLPLDTRNNAIEFIETLQPEIAIFTKYEYWYHYFDQLHRHSIPLYMISGIFRPDQVFFKWYGGINRNMLSLVSHFFVQDKESKILLQKLNVHNVTVSGDTRFDRVWANAKQPKNLPDVIKFKCDEPVFIAGSTWPKDEQLLLSLIERYPGWKFIIAPHETSEAKIDSLIKLLSGKKFLRYTQMADYRDVAKYQVLIIDTIGLLSSLYSHAQIAYIGGGFGAGIHNTLEAAAYHIPVIFGPKYQNFREARELVNIQAGFSIKDEAELKKVAALLIDDPAYCKAAGQKAGRYVREHLGATHTVIEHITAQNS